MTGKIKGALSATIRIIDINNIAYSVKRLNDIFSNFDVTAEDDIITISGEEIGKYYYEPPVFYTRNGDGYPGEYDDDLSFSNTDDVSCQIVDALHEIEFDIINVVYEAEELYEEEDYGEY